MVDGTLPRAACSAMAALTRLSLGMRYCFSFCNPLLRDEPRTYSRTLAGLSCMYARIVRKKKQSFSVIMRTDCLLHRPQPAASKA